MKHLSTTTRRLAARGPIVTVSAVLAAAVLAACGSSSASSSPSTSAASSASAALGSSGSSGSSSKSSFTVNLGYIGNTGKLTGPEGYAYATGQLQKWLAADGITIKATEFANGPLLTAAVTGGSIDLGIVGDTPALIAKSKGLPVDMINQGEINLPAWIVAKKGGPTTIAALKGKTIAVPFGSYMYRYLEGILADNGLTGKVTLTNQLPPEAIAAAENGSVDAVALPAWEVAPIIQAGGTPIAKSETTPSIQGTEVTIITKAALAAHPQLATDWDAVRLEAVKYAHANPAGFYAFEAAAQGVKAGASAAKQFLPLSDFPDKNYSPQGLNTLQATLNFLVSAKQATSFSLTGWEAPSTASSS